MREKVAALFLAVSLLASFAGAKDVFLFDENKQAKENYEEVLNSVEPKDTLKFHNGKSFYVYKRLGSGDNSMFFFVQNSEGRALALRVPLKAHKAEWLDKMHDLYVNEFSKIPNFPIAEVVDFESREYMAHVLLELVLDYDQFLEAFKRTNYDENFGPWVKLKEFARQTARYRLIGELSPGQIFYTKSGWRMVDWGDKNVLATKASDPSIFNIDEFDSPHAVLNAEYRILWLAEISLPLPKRKFKEEIEEIIRTEREAMGLTPSAPRKPSLAKLFWAACVAPLTR